MATVPTDAPVGPSLTLVRSKLAALGGFYRRHLLQEVMPFWEARTRDTEAGGYLTCFDRTGGVTDTDKYIWFQGRQLYMFSALYRQVERRPEWLALARHGRDFIVRHAYAGGGRWHYQLDRAGRRKEGTISIFTDHFVLQGLCGYALASGSDADAALIADTYAAIERNTRDPNFKDLYHGTWSARSKGHGLYMMAAGTGAVAEGVLGAARTRPLIDEALEQILRVFARDERELLFESVGRDGQLIDSPEGRLINPGHALESAWFCLEEGRKRGDRAIVERAAQIARWSYRCGRDPECGGIYSFLDASGRPPPQTDWHRATGMRWDDKAWWVHSESLYTLALAADETGDLAFLDGFLELHAWCQKFFYDPAYGEWYSELRRDGTVKNDHKGSLWKAAYHLPRALMKIMQLCERANTSL